MDGEAQVTTSEPANTPPPAEVSTETQTEVAHETSQPEHQSFKEKPEGFDPVDIKTATPEQIEARLSRLYKNMKTYQGDARTLREDNQRLLQAFEALQNQQGQIVNHIQTNDFKDAESRLAEQRDDAWARGDVKGYNNAMDQIAEIKAEKKTREILAKQQSQVEQPKPNGYMNGKRMPVQDAVQMALDSGDIEPQDAQIFKSWESQADDYGSKLRPWTDTNHPLNQAAAIEGRAVFENPAYGKLSFADKLREIDRRMGIKSASSQNNQVLGSGNLTRGNRQPKVDLSPQIERMAVRTKFGGPKAKSDADHIEAYRQAVIRSKAKGGR